MSIITVSGGYDGIVLNTGGYITYSTTSYAGRLLDEEIYMNLRLRRKLADKEDLADALMDRMMELRQTVREKDREIDKLEEICRSQKSEPDHTQELRILQAQLTAKDQTIASLEEKIRAFESSEAKKAKILLLEAELQALRGEEVKAETNDDFCDIKHVGVIAAEKPSDTSQVKIEDAEDDDFCDVPSPASPA